MPRGFIQWLKAACRLYPAGLSTTSRATDVPSWSSAGLENCFSHFCVIRKNRFLLVEIEKKKTNGFAASCDAVISYLGFFLLRV